MPARSQLSQGSRQTLVKLTANFQSHIARATASAQNALEAKAADEARRQAERHQRERRIQLRKDRLLPLARRGLANLMAVASDNDLLEMLRVSQEARPYQRFSFYHATRLSGDAWNHGTRTWADSRGRLTTCDAERVVEISFHSHGIELFAGANFASDINRRFVLGHQAPNEEWEPILLALLDSVENGTKVRHALDWQQLTDEWNPDELLIHVLAECAQQRNWEYYLGIALKNF